MQRNLPDDVSDCTYCIVLYLNLHNNKRLQHNFPVIFTEYYIYNIHCSISLSRVIPKLLLLLLLLVVYAEYTGSPQLMARNVLTPFPQRLNSLVKIVSLIIFLTFVF